MQTVHPAPTSRMPHLISTSPWAGRAVAWNAWLSWNNSKTWGQPIWPGVICSYCWTKSSQLGIGLVWSLDMSIQSAWIMNRISPRCQQFREIQLSQDRRKKTCNHYLYSFFNYHPSTKKSSVIDIKNIHPPPKKKKQESCTTPHVCHHQFLRPPPRPNKGHEDFGQVWLTYQGPKGGRNW